MCRSKLVVLALGFSACFAAVAEEFPTSEQPQIRLLSGSFDALAVPDQSARVPEGAPVAVTGVPAGDLSIIQFRSEPLAAWQEELKGLGVEIIDYIPELAFLVRLPEGLDRAAITKLPFIYTLVDVQPGFKLSPSLIDKLGGSDGPAESVRLRISLLPGVDPDLVAKELLQRFPKTSLEYVFRHAHRPAVTVEVEGEQMHDLVGAVSRSAWAQLIEPLGSQKPINNNSVWIGQSYDLVNGPVEAQEPAPKPYAQSATIWAQGLLGQGQIIGVSDSELEPTLCQFEDPLETLTAQSVTAPNPVVLNPNHRKVIAWNAPFQAEAIGDFDWFLHGTHCAGSALGDDLAHVAGVDPLHHDENDGMAPAAKLFFADIGYNGNNCTGIILTGSVFDMWDQQHQAGARIATNSYNTPVLDAPSDFDVEAMVYEHPDFLIFFAAGNTGQSGGNPVPGSINAGGGNKNVIAVGATETYIDGSQDPENMAGFSSMGPSSDDRIKPDLSVPGMSIYSSRYETRAIFDDDPDYATLCDPADPNVCLTTFGCYTMDPTDSCPTHALSGTSMASPTAAGLAALTRQYFTDGFYPSGQANAGDAMTPSAALLKAVLLNGSRNMTGTNSTHGPLADAPSNKQGWGRLTLDDVLYFPGDARNLWITDTPLTVGPATGESWYLQFKHTSSAEPLKITMVWTDPPPAGFVGSGLINDLDLIVRAPDGTVYKGNQFTADDINIPGDKVSAPNPPGRDSDNNVEGVWLPSPQTGAYHVEIHGANVAGYQGVYSQGFSLAVTGVIDECTAGAGPANLIATKRIPSDVQLIWDTVPGATGYRIYRNTSGCQTPMLGQLIATVGASPNFYIDSTTESGNTYHYTVRATLADGCETLDSICASETIPIGPSISSVDPFFALNNDPAVLTILGSDFIDAPRVFLGTDTDPEKFELSPVTFVGTGELQAPVPVNLLDGLYDLKVINPDGQEASLPDALQIASPAQVPKIFVPESGLIGQDDYQLFVVELDGFSIDDTVSLGSASRPQDIYVSQTSKLGTMLYYYGQKLAVFDALANTVLTTYGQSGGVATTIHPDGTTSYVLRRALPTGSLKIRNLSTGQVIDEFPVGDSWVWDMEVSRDGLQYYIANSEENTVSIHDAVTNAELIRLPVPDCSYGMAPMPMVTSHDNTRLYVGDYCSDVVTVIDTINLVVVDTWDLDDGTGYQRRPWGIEISDDDSLVYVGFNTTSSALQGDMIKIDAATGTTLTTITHNRRWMFLKMLNDKLYGLSTTDTLARLDPDTLVIEDEIDFNVYTAGSFGWLDVDPITIIGGSPTTGCDAGGTTVQISGSAFQGEVVDDGGAVVQYPTQVFFGGIEAVSVKLVDSQTLEAIAPAQSGTVDLMVLNPNGRSATLTGGFTYTSSCAGPTVTDITPDRGLNNDSTPVTIEGTEFALSVQAFLGTDAEPEKYPLSAVTFVGSTELQATVPVNLPDGDYDVRVVNPDLQAGSLDEGFRVSSPLQVPRIYYPESGSIGQPDYVMHIVNLDDFTTTTSSLGPASRPLDIYVSATSKLGAMVYYYGQGLAKYDALEDEVLQTYGNTPRGSVVIHPDGKRAYVVQRRIPQNEVVVRNLETDQLEAQFYVGDEWARGIEASPDGRHVFVANALDNDISIIDAATNTEFTRLPVEPCVNIPPHEMVSSNDSTRLYVANYCGDTVTVLDMVNITILDTWDISDQTGYERRPWSIAISDDDATLFIGFNTTSSSLQGDMLSIDTATGNVLTTITHNLRWADLKYMNDMLYGLSTSGDVHELDPVTLQVQRSAGLSLLGYRFGWLNIEPIGINGAVPNAGCEAGGTAVTFDGNAFQGEIRDDQGGLLQAGTQVFFGTVEATTVALTDSGTLQVVAPAHPAGIVDVTVLNPNGRSATLVGGFAYTASCSPPVTPPPVPDGWYGSPITGYKLAGDGGMIRVSWDVGTCPADDYHILYGSLAGLSGHLLDGVVCDLGISGSHDWLDVPSGDLWFLVVGENEVAVEGSWGKESSGAERGGTNSCGECGVIGRDNLGTCP